MIYGKEGLVIEGRVQSNALHRARFALENIKAGKASFRSFFGFEHEDAGEIVDYLLKMVHREQMRGAYLEQKWCPGRFWDESFPKFDEWLTQLNKEIKP